MNALLRLALVFVTMHSLVSWSAQPSDIAMQRSTKLANQLCISCHGPDGRSTNSRFPKLAGQQSQYVENQLRNFKEHVRAEPDAHDFMWGIAAKLDEELIAGLAAYYESKQPAPPQPKDPKLTSLGNNIFHNGIPERGVTACATCHGSNANGNGMFPRLAGQHAEYVFTQLQLIQSTVRNVPVMHGVVKDLKPEELQALASYLSSL